ncbi:uncharacterized protein LOC142550024 [Primulina tabacum]|uniref:uncharacterized protein LOC142550024 n=1 Tax=Primulina tabacum TaxID=48773 RepID=UPI003F59F94D
MPPRQVIHRDSEDRREEEIPQPPPNQDASARVLAGMTQLLEQYVGNATRVRHEAVYERFRTKDPEDFSGTTDPFVAEGCIRSLEGDAFLWWEGAERGVNLATLTWEGFKRVFYDKYFTTDVRSRLKREFMSLLQGDSFVVEFVQKFDRGCHFVPLIGNDAAEKLRYFLDAFRTERSLKDIEWEMQRKRNRAQKSSQKYKRLFMGPPKRPGHHKPQGQPPKENVPKTEERPLYKECNHHHYGMCMWGRILLPDVATYALLDSGATHSFISESFMKRLEILPEDVESGFRVTVPSGEHMVSTSIVKYVELKLQRNVIRADLIVLPMPEFDIILGIDWPTQNGATIDFRRRSELNRRGCQGSIASIISIPDTDSRSIEDVEVVKDFPDVFPDDVSGIPPEREVDLLLI